MKKRVILMLVVALAFVWAVGCTAQPPQEAEPEEIVFTLYYGDNELMELVAEERTVSVSEDVNILLIAVQELTKEPVTPDAIVLMPLETEVLGVTATDDIITIDFNENLRENFNGGSSGEALLITSIVDTVTGLDGYETHKVAFLINGEQFDSIGGHISAEELFERSQD
ncbi:MAG: GerMN domain-containing protein [Firmicutes bacterium]|nr:GerMN domain-containing protein [Bacillota bacterium]MCL5994144.1 GerMN domain-containing protein [Bacillota bacterium]